MLRSLVGSEMCIRDRTVRVAETVRVLRNSNSDSGEGVMVVTVNTLGLTGVVDWAASA